jgi:hypothetical protein
MKFINSLSASDRFDVYRDIDFADALHNVKIINDDLYEAVLAACYSAHKVYDHGMTHRPFLEVELKEEVEDVFDWLHEFITAVSKNNRAICKAIDAIAAGVWESQNIPLF